jgi:tRNA (adenine57-N1/adenine58-N1)-methyltransferase
MKEKELVLLLGKKSYLVKVGYGKLNTEFGIIDLSRLLKKNFGDSIQTHLEEKFVIVKPTVLDILTRVAKRLPQIVTPKDASLIIAYTGISQDSLVVDSGTGSGFLAIFLGFYCKDGKIVSYEKNPEFAKIAKENIKLCGLENVEIKEKDILKGIEEKNVDLVTLDMEKAEEVIKHAYDALKPGGWLVVYSPYIEQVISVRSKITKLNFTQLKTIESIVREWRVGRHTLPEVSGVMHTGWLTFARKVI